MDKKIYRAVKIDAYNNYIDEVWISTNHNDINEHIGSELFCLGIYLNEDEEDLDALMVDDEGWLRSEDVTRGFVFDGRVFAGNGLVVGADDEGDTDHAMASVKKIKKRVQFMPKGLTISEELREKILGSSVIVSWSGEEK